MSSGGGQFYKFGPFFDNAGSLYRGIRINVFAAGTVANKTYWTDEGKVTPGTFPLVDSDNDGIVVAYFDGDYRFQVKDSGGLDLDVTIDWDNVKLSSDTATMWEGNLGTALPAAAAINKGQLFALENAQANLQALYFNKGDAFVTVVDDVVRAEHFASLNAAITDIGASVKTLVIQNIQTVAANLTIPSNVTTLYTGADPQVSANSGVTVTHNGPILSGRPLSSIHTGLGTHAYGTQLLNLPVADSGGTVPGTQITAGALGSGVTLPAPQVTAGGFIAGVTLPADQLTSGAVPAGVTVALARIVNSVPWSRVVGPATIQTAVTVVTTSHTLGTITAPAYIWITAEGRPTNSSANANIRLAVVAGAGNTAVFEFTTNEQILQQEGPINTAIDNKRTYSFSGLIKVTTTGVLNIDVETRITAGAGNFDMAIDKMGSGLFIIPE